jgi:hypothetical protein
VQRESAGDADDACTHDDDVLIGLGLLSHAAG